MSNKNILMRVLALPSETRTIEFKRMGSRNEGLDRTLQSIVAMANTDGGIILFGVEDPQKAEKSGIERIFGVEENLELFDELGRAVNKISPPIPRLWPPDFINVEEKGVRIGLLSIPKAADGFRSYENHVYVRLEKGNKRLSPQELVSFAYVKGFVRADNETINVPFHLLNTAYYESWRKKRGIEDATIESVLEKTGLAKLVDGTLRPTRAAILLFAEHPNDLMETKCAIRVFQFTGRHETIKETLNLLGTPKTIEGPIIKQIADAHEYVLNLLRTGIRIPSGFTTTYQVPERAVKEAITNAVIHRDYYTKRDIEIKIFEDRMLIESPGLLPFNITPSNIGHERAFGYRNDLLVKHLREFPDPPNLDQNEGVRAMRKTMKDASLYPPIFVTYPTTQDSVQVVLLNEKAPNEWEKISHCLNKDKYISNKDARAILEISDTVKVSKLFNRWVKQGLLIKLTPKTGAKRNVRYRLPSTDEKSLFTLPHSK